MMQHIFLGAGLLLAMLLGGCSEKANTEAIPDEDNSERYPLGEGSQPMRVASMREPAANLSSQEKLAFYTGHSFARNPWVSAPSSTTARDGLGPLFNARSCMACHINGGRSNIDQSDDLTSLIIKLSVPPKRSESSDTTLRATEGVIPEPTYGGQLQSQSLGFQGVVAEAKIDLYWQWREGAYPDGRNYRLRSPRVELHELGYGEMSKDTRISLRIAPSLGGMGFIEAIDESTILEFTDPDDRNHDGVSGRPNYVWDIEAQATRIGRFGWKASQPTVRQQTAAALRNDMGITSELFPHENCTARQANCLNAPSGGANNKSGFEIEDKLLEAVTLFSESVGIAARSSALTDSERQGRQLFYELGCHACHRPSYRTSEQFDRSFHHQRIWPYSDFLLHDMGDGLADERTEFLANGSEWRTPPLWGLSVIAKINPHASFLHDGRARNLEEAILWHGGEALNAQQRFTELKRSQRSALVEFLWRL